MQLGPGIEITMRSRMIESQRVVSNRMLRSAAATQLAKPGMFSSLRTGIGSAIRDAGAQLASIERRPAIGECTTVTCAR